MPKPASYNNPIVREIPLGMMGVQRAISREHAPQDSLISSVNIWLHSPYDYFDRPSQRPELSTFCNTSTGDPILGLQPFGYVVPPGGTYGSTGPLTPLYLFAPYPSSGQYNATTVYAGSGNQTTTSVQGPSTSSTAFNSTFSLTYTLGVATNFATTGSTDTNYQATETTDWDFSVTLGQPSEGQAITQQAAWVTTDQSYSEFGLSSAQYELQLTLSGTNFGGPITYTPINFTSTGVACSTVWNNFSSTFTIEIVASTIQATSTCYMSMYANGNLISTKSTNGFIWGNPANGFGQLSSVSQASGSQSGSPTFSSNVFVS
jgi:hypothetical protein